MLPRWIDILISGGLVALLALTMTQPADTHTRNVAGHSVALPLVINPVVAPVPAPTQQGGVFPLGDPRSSSADLALDAAGNLHTTIVAYEPASAEPPVYYGFCAASNDCLNPANWQLTIVARGAEQAEIQVTAAGQPRLIFRKLLEESGLRHPYFYAECNSTCGDTNQWAVTTIGGTSAIEAIDWELPQRGFALDRQGRPRFIYYTGTPGDSNKGMFYLSCDQQCSQPEQWQQTTISLLSTTGDEIYHDPVLVFTSQNQPRILSYMTADQSGIYYIGCDQECHEASNWQRTLIAERGFGPLAAWDLELTSTDQPRAAIYVERFPNGSGDLLLYGWCQSNCFEGDNWSGGPIGLAQNDGETPDLALDSQDRPRIAYRSTGAADTTGLGYLWCNRICESSEAIWNQELLEPSNTLDQRFPIALPPACEQGTWSAGYQPNLVLDSQGNPRIASEAKRLLRCAVSDPQDPSKPPTTQIVEYRHARFVLANAP